MKKSLNFLVAPNHAPEKFIDWHLVNSSLQEQLRFPVNLLLPNDHDKFKELSAQNPDVIYANPFDVSYFINNRNYVSIAKPAKRSDEIVFFSSKDSKINKFSDIKAGSKIAIMLNKEIEIVALRLMEAIGLTKQDVEFIHLDYPRAIFRKVNMLDVDLGIVLADLYHELEAYRKEQFDLLIESKMELITHIFLMKRDDKALISKVQQCLLDIYAINPNSPMFKNLGWNKGIELLTEEDGLFLTDILDTLQD